MAKYSKEAQKEVAESITQMHEGKLKMGKSNKEVTNPKQAIAIGLSEAREKNKKESSKSAEKQKIMPKKKLK